MTDSEKEPEKGTDGRRKRRGAKRRSAFLLLLSFFFSRRRSISVMSCKGFQVGIYGKALQHNLIKRGGDLRQTRLWESAGLHYCN